MGSSMGLQIKRLDNTDLRRDYDNEALGCLYLGIRQ
jgi:hypothetical protein